MMVLTELAAPTSDQRQHRQDEAARQPKYDRRQPERHHRAEEEHASLPADRSICETTSAAAIGADRLRRRKPAVLDHPHIQDVTGDDRHERVGRGEKGGKEVQDHGRQDDRLVQDEAHPLADRIPG